MENEEYNKKFEEWKKQISEWEIANPGKDWKDELNKSLNGESDGGSNPPPPPPPPPGHG